MAEVNGKVNYEDSTPIPAQQDYTPSNIQPLATELATFIRTKMYGVDVRESLARWIEIMLAVQTYINDDETAFKIDMQNKQDSVKDRQTQVEGTMSDVVDQFKAVIANVTKDSEVALARDSVRFGDYTVLDDRLEYIESWLAAHVPAGFHVSIKHNQNRQPKVAVHYYEYAIGTEDHGFGTGPYGLGETSTQTISCTVDYRDDDTAVINLPLAYALTGIVTYKAGYWYLIDGHKILRFDLGNDIDDTKATAGNGSNETSTNANGGGYAGDLGLSSYQIAVKNGFTGNISQWLASLVGPKGDPGPTGTVDNAGLTTAPAFVNLQTQVNNSAVGTNLLTGTSSELKSGTVPAGREDVGQKATNGFQYAVNAGETYTYQIYVGKENPVDAYVLIGSYGESKNWYGILGQGNTVLSNTGGVSEVTFTIPNEVRYINLTPIGCSEQSTDVTVYWKEEKLENGSVTTDWCPNPAEVLTQADYAKIQAAIVALGGSLS